MRKNLFGIERKITCNKNSIRFKISVIDLLCIKPRNYTFFHFFIKEIFNKYMK